MNFFIHGKCSKLLPDNIYWLHQTETEQHGHPTGVRFLSNFQIYFKSLKAF